MVYEVRPYGTKRTWMLIRSRCRHICWGPRLEGLSWEQRFMNVSEEWAQHCCRCDKQKHDGAGMVCNQFLDRR